ncbi:hypothetical protein GCM10009665_51580 [Kitasatospora nipponensis]|uniref:Secreted protein n=1 Tax=Kitasatospora nipponensis TaxID=258049 RepID=A0ABN1WMT9_9ACTN
MPTGTGGGVPAQGQAGSPQGRFGPPPGEIAAAPTGATSTATTPPAGVTPPPAPPAARWRGALERLRRAKRTAPGRLRLSLAVLLVLVLGFGALTGWQVTGRTQAADQVLTHSQPLSQNAAEIYRSLADADTTAAAGFLLAGNEPREVRERYQSDLTTAAQLLTQAAAQSTGSPGAQSLISQLNQQLPVYSGLVETARANDRLGLPLGAAYLRYASDLMQKQVLPLAKQLSDAELQRLDRDYTAAQTTPWAAYLLGLLTLLVLLWFQVMLRRRTNRVLNPGLVGATAAVLASLLWLLAGASAADSALADSRQHGATPLKALNTARTATLQARTAENLDLVARGSTDAYANQWNDNVKADTGALATAAQLAPPGAAASIHAAQDQLGVWTHRHDGAVRDNTAGDYQGAVNSTVGNGDSSSQPAFEATDRDLAKAAEVERAAFASAAGTGRDATGTVAWAAGLLALLAAAGLLRGIGQRLAEYR